MSAEDSKEDRNIKKPVRKAGKPAAARKAEAKREAKARVPLRPQAWQSSRLQAPAASARAGAALPAAEPKIPIKERAFISQAHAGMIVLARLPDPSLAADSKGVINYLATAGIKKYIILPTF